MLRAVAQCALNFTISGFALERFALVILRFAFAQAKVNLRETFGEINLQRNQRHTFGVKLSGKAVDFFFVKEKPTRSKWIDVVAIAELVRIDMRVVEPTLATLNPHKRIIDGGAGIAEAFYFSPFKLDTGVVRLGDEIIPARLVILNRRDHYGQYIGRTRSSPHKNLRYSGRLGIDSISGWISPVSS